MSCFVAFCCCVYYADLWHHLCITAKYSEKDNFLSPPLRIYHTWRLWQCWDRGLGFLGFSCGGINPTEKLLCSLNRVVLLSARNMDVKEFTDPLDTFPSNIFIFVTPQANTITQHKGTVGVVKKNTGEKRVDLSQTRGFPPPSLRPRRPEGGSGGREPAPALWQRHLLAAAWPRSRCPRPQQLLRGRLRQYPGEGGGRSCPELGQGPPRGPGGPGWQQAAAWGEAGAVPQLPIPHPGPCQPQPCRGCSLSRVHLFYWCILEIVMCKDIYFTKARGSYVERLELDDP